MPEINAFYNPTVDLADNAIDGLLRSRGNLRRVQKGAQHRVVVHAVVDRSKVAVVSGGGAGHEPLHAGLVGPGLLAAAVSGGVFASPSADAVLTAIEAASGDAGCCLVVKQYTGDKLNFGLAAARARANGIPVEIVVVAEDVSLDDLPAHSARGLAATALVHKVAAWHAEQGASLKAVADAARRAAAAACTVGVARASCTVPGAPAAQRVPHGSVEVGIGIHGEQGRETVPLESSAQLIDRLCNILSRKLTRDARYAVLFNNLGALSQLESFCLFNDLSNHPLFACVDYIMGPCALVTALDMAGFSITFIRLDQEFVKPLLEPIDIPAWPGFTKVVPPPEELPCTSERPLPQPSANPRIRTSLIAVLDGCKAMTDRLNQLDACCGDGDTGLTVKRAADAIWGELDTLPLNQPALFFAQVGEIAAASGGTLGGIVGLLLAVAANSLPDNVSWDSDNAVWGDALQAGLRTVSDVLGSKPGDRTMIDALAPAVEMLKQGKSLADAARSAQHGADETAQMQASVGRAANLPPEAIRGFMDPGAQGVASVFLSLVHP